MHRREKREIVRARDLNILLYLMSGKEDIDITSSVSWEDSMRDMMPWEYCGNQFKQGHVVGLKCTAIIPPWVPPAAEDILPKDNAWALLRLMKWLLSNPIDEVSNFRDAM